MKRLVAGVAVLLVACGSGDFDEDGLRDYIEAHARPTTSAADKDRLVDTVREDCDSDRSENEWAEFAVGLDDQYEAMMNIACPGVLP